jgi:hypothetical protein
MHRGHLMKTITTNASVRKADASLDATLNPVALRSGEIVSWAAAFPRPGQAAPLTARPTHVLADLPCGQEVGTSSEQRGVTSAGPPPVFGPSRA